MTSNDIKKIACAKWGRYKVKGPFTSPLKFYRGIEMASLLGKQNELTNFGDGTRSVTEQIALGKNGYSRGSVGNELYSSHPYNLSLNTAHKYFFWAQLGGTMNQSYISLWVKHSSASPTQFNPMYRIYDKKHVSVIVTGISAFQTAHLYGSNAFGADSTIKSVILLDLTEMGLDTLTAQQFYDQYNHLFDQLANGEIINKAITFNPSPAITLSSGDYWFNQTGKTSNQTLGSLLLPKGITKITDANGVEVEFE